jgi:hypothetical protein
MSTRVFQVDGSFAEVAVDEVVLVHEGQRLQQGRDVVAQGRQVNRQVLGLAPIFKIIFGRNLCKCVIKICKYLAFYCYQLKLCSTLPEKIYSFWIKF